MASQQHIVEELFGAALDHSPHERAAFLDQACRDAPELRRRVEELLVAEQRLGSFLEQPAIGPNHLAWPQRSFQGDDLGNGEAETSFSQFLKPQEVIIDRFRVVRFIARGGMGEIYEVEDLFLQNARVALKVILPHVAASAGSARRFEQEVLLARRVIHPNLCPIYDIARETTGVPPFLFLTMKLLDGETLASRLRRRESISQRDAFCILRQMCAGLTALHDAGILHRDIKPTNVMLGLSATAALHLYIMDFGLARSYESSISRDASGMVAGTLGYLAPELLRGEQPSQESDIFALGVLLRMVQDHIAPELMASIPVSRSSLLFSAWEEKLWRQAVAQFRSEDPDTRRDAFAQVRDALITDRSPLAQIALAQAPTLLSPKSSRRRFVVGATATTGVLAAVGLWNHDHLRDMLNPLPKKRFVALIQWPTAFDSRLEHMLSDVTEVIGRELTRAEVFDHDLLVIADTAAKRLNNVEELREIKDSSGANLVLAASAHLKANHLYLTLKVMDLSLLRPLRERLLQGDVDNQTPLPAKAVEAAAELLGISRYTRDEQLLRVGTQNPDAYSAFQAAEALRRQDTPASLNEAITLYLRALELDPHYAVATAKLSWAYLRTYALHGDPAALRLARDTGAAAITRDPSLVDGHLVLAWVYEQMGDEQNTSRELANALALDPSDPNTLRFQARYFAENGRVGEAEDRLRQLVRARPNFWLGHNELGSLLSGQAKYEEALREFHTAKISVPKNPVPLNNIGSVLLQQGQLRQAEEVLQQSFRLQPDDFAATNLATIARAKGRFQEANRLAHTAVSLNPEEPTNFLELGDSSLAAGSRLAGLSAYKRAAEKQQAQLQTQPNNGPGWMLLALCRAKVGLLPAAVAALDRADALHADDIDSQLLKVRTLGMLQRQDEALALLQKCLKRGATKFQLQTLPDIDKLRERPEFLRLLEAPVSRPEQT